MAPHAQMVLRQFQTALEAAKSICAMLYSHTDVITSKAAYGHLCGYTLDIACRIYTTYHGALSVDDVVMLRGWLEDNGYDVRSFR